MKIKFLVIILIMVMVLYGAKPNNEKSIERLGELFQNSMDESLQNSGAIGVSAAVLMADGQMWKGASGISHEGAPLTTDMLFDIASVQKNLQAALTLKLAEQGFFSLEDPLEKWLPYYSQINGKITIRQLLNMTSGIDDFVGDSRSPYRIGYRNIKFKKIWTWEKIRSVLIKEPNFNPGEACAYSTSNYIVLRQIVEKACGNKQIVELQNRLLRPYHLHHTLVDFFNPIPKNMKIAHGWCDTEGNRKPEDLHGTSLNWIASLSPMLIYSTPEDMVKWTDALFHQKTVLKPETLKAMLTFFRPVRDEPMMKGYGLGVVDINIGLFFPKWRNVNCYGHLGSQFGYMTYVGYFPDYEVSVAIMINRGCDRDSERAIVAVSTPIFDMLFKHLGVSEFTSEEPVIE